MQTFTLGQVVDTCDQQQALFDIIILGKDDKRCMLKDVVA